MSTEERNEVKATVKLFPPKIDNFLMPIIFLFFYLSLLESTTSLLLLLSWYS